MDHLRRLGLTLNVIPYPSAEHPDHTVYRAIRTKQKGKTNDYGSIVVTLYDHILYIRSLDVPVRHRGKGIARALLEHALEDQMTQHPELTVSELEDHSDRPWDAPGNLYYSFGYRFKPDNLEEKILCLEDYKRKINRAQGLSSTP